MPKLIAMCIEYRDHTRSAPFASKSRAQDVVVRDLEAGRISFDEALEKVQFICKTDRIPVFNPEADKVLEAIEREVAAARERSPRKIRWEDVLLMTPLNGKNCSDPRLS